MKKAVAAEAALQPQEPLPRDMRFAYEMSAGDAIRTNIPQRLDRLPWSRFHVLLVVALGVTWILDGRWVPESPRWLVTHCRAEEAERTTREIERHVAATAGKELPEPEGELQVHPRKVFGLGMIFHSMLRENRDRSLLVIACWAVVSRRCCLVG